MKNIIKKLQKIGQKAFVSGLFSLVLTSNLAPVLTNISSTIPWADFGQKLAETINLKIDEEKYKTISVIATAYSSTPDQTDDTPFITAANTEVREGVIAANFLKFHTKIKIPDLYGDKVFSVEDRMNRRYTEAVPPRIDIWLSDRHLAKKFGVKQINIVVLD